MGNGEKSTVSLLLVIGLFMMAVSGCATYSTRTIGATPEDGALAVRAGDRVLLRYRYEGVPYKPYVQELFTPDGVNILRDAPADHLHHHALMFAVAVDGVNFWEEQNQPGKQQHRSFAHSVQVGNREKPHVVRFDEQLDWVNPRTNGVLAEEMRTIEVRETKGENVTLVTWKAELSSPAGKDSVMLTGSHYFGLGVRFVESMDQGGQFQNADGKPGVVFRGDERLVRSNWCAYTARADGKLVTVAMFGHPDNPRHPTTWFTMTKPFAYLSATLALHEEPLKVTAAEPLMLRYGVALWDGDVHREQIEKVYSRWVEWSR